MSHPNDYVDLSNDEDDTSPFFLQAQRAAFERFQQKPSLQEEESAAIAAALVASEEEEVERQQQRRGLDQELSQADQDLAQALEISAAEAMAKQVDESLSQSQQKRQKERHQGIWDCSRCTYENPPYAPLCIACEAKPPEGTLTFQDIPPDLKFGLELELLIPDGVRDGYKLEWLAQELTKLGPPIVKFHGYSHETTDHWKVVTDSSVQGQNNKDLCLELVSPVLQGKDGLTQLRVLLEHIRQLGIATNHSCGFHVHVDATNKSLSTLKRIAHCFVALENAFDLLVASHHRHANQNRYCQSNRIAFGTMSNRQRWDAIDRVYNRYQLVELLNPNRDRYRKLNLTNLINPNRPSTMEFRLHGGVEELPQAEAWVRLLLRFCHQAGAGTTNIMQLSEAATPTMELQELWKIVDCPGLEQFYVLDRQLFDPSIPNPWRCKQCRKVFGTSRALSQHVEATGHPRG